MCKLNFNLKRHFIKKMKEILQKEYNDNKNINNILKYRITSIREFNNYIIWWHYAHFINDKQMNILQEYFYKKQNKLMKKILIT